MPKTYHICWNEGKTEGFISDDAKDANAAKTGKRTRHDGFVSISTVAEAFHNAYSDEQLTIEKVEI